MTESPKVTVVIPVYNREKYVGDAIGSILAQTFTDFELLVIDDGSTDGSVEVVRSYRDPRITLVCNEANWGVAKTRNRGIQLARGEYLAFLDSDDWAYPERLAKQVAFLDSHPDYAAVGAWIVWMDEEGRSLRRVKRKPVWSDEIAAQRLFQQGIENSASTARTVMLREYSHQEHYDLSEDFDLWARIAAKYKLATLPEVLVRRRMHGGRTTLEKADRIKRTRLAIYASQLKALGVAFTEIDLERHVLLRRMSWPAKQLDLPIPDLTVMSGGTLTLPQEEKTRACLRGLRTKNLLVLTVGVKPTQAKNILRELNYTYEQIAYMSYDKRARVIKAVTARNLGRGDREKSKISNGLFAACLAFYQGAPEVISAGFSLSSDGRAYSTALDKRHHVKPDGDAIHAMHQRKLRLYTSEPALAQLCGIELV